MFFFRETIEEKKNREYCVLKQYSRTGQGGGSTPTVYEASACGRYEAHPIVHEALLSAVFLQKKRPLQKQQSLVL